jgi:hypothetical protein
LRKFEYFAAFALANSPSAAQLSPSSGSGLIHEVRGLDPQGRRFSGIVNHGELKVWDATTGRESLTTNAVRVWKVALCPNGKRIAVLDDTLK